jgi:hypothetical protein
MAHLIAQFLATALGAFLAAYAAASYVDKNPENYRVGWGLTCMVYEWFLLPFVLVAWFFNPVAGFALLMLLTAISASLARHWVNLKVRDNGTCSLVDLFEGCFFKLGMLCLSEALYWGHRLFFHSANAQQTNTPDQLTEIVLVWIFLVPLAFVIAQWVGWSLTRVNRVKA